MAVYNIICDGPGPHIPISGIIGTSDIPVLHGGRCSSKFCVPLPVSTEIVNQTILRAKALAGLDINVRYLALDPKAKEKEDEGQIIELTKQVSALTHIVLGEFGNVNGI